MSKQKGFSTLEMLTVLGLIMVMTSAIISMEEQGHGAVNEYLQNQQEHIKAFKGFKNESN